jgi:4-amino-4-deoxy-L-arabinose transferase-like glycosyltransferase
MIPIGASPKASAEAPGRRSGRLLAAGYLGLLLVQASIAPLQEPDEGRTASIAWEMLSSGDWITPRLNGIGYYEKPPLFFWSEAATMAVLGRVAFSVRLPSVLASFLSVLLVARWGRRLGRPGSGILAGVILASLILFALLARVAIVDPLLMLAITAALYCADRLLLDGESARPPSRRHRLGFWAALALAAVTKGPIGVILPLGSVVAFSLTVRNWKGLGSLFLPDGIALFTLIALPWFVLVSRRNPDYAAEFFLGQNLDRLVQGSRFNRDRPFWYYVPVFLVGFLPWSLLLPGILKSTREAWKNRTLEESRRRLYLAWAVVWPFLVLSFAHSKLLHYLLPLCPPFALLAADRLLSEWAGSEGSPLRAQLFRVRLLGFGGVVLAVALVLLVLAILAPETIARLLGFDPAVAGYESDLAKIRRFRTPLAGAALILLPIGASALGAVVLLSRKRPAAALLSLAGALVGGIVGVQFLIEPMGPAISARALAAKTARYLGQDTPVVLYRRYLRGMTFYLEKRVLLSDAPYNEFGHEVPPDDPFSLAGHPERLREFLERSPSAVFVLDGPSRLPELEGYSGRSFKVLDQEGEFLIVQSIRR